MQETETKLYPWQEQAIQKYLNLDERKGIIKAVTGAGKSLPAREIAKKIGGHILITSHSKPILDQWEIIMRGIDDVNIETLHNLHSKKYDKKVSLLIIDEVHRSTSPEFRKIYDNIDYNNILGLSATPNEDSIKLCGDILVDVGYEEANISPFLVKFHGIELTYSESQDYYRLSKAIGRAMEDDTKKDDDIMKTIMKRRDIVYKAKRRIPYSLDLIKQEYENGKKIIVFTQRKEQANELSMRLTNIPHVLYHSDTTNGNNRKDLANKYKNGEVRLMITVGMVREGFDDIDTDCGIVVSTTLSESFHIQTIGRIIRHKPNKMAIVHIILANHTSDTKILEYSVNYDFELNNVLVPVTKDTRLKYYKGKKFSFNHIGIFYKEGKGFDERRVHIKMHPIYDELRKIKRSGGSFTVSEDGVYTKMDRKVIKVSDEIPKFVEDEERNKPLSNKKMTWEELMEELNE